MDRPCAFNTGLPSEPEKEPAHGDGGRAPQSDNVTTSKHTVSMIFQIIQFQVSRQLQRSSTTRKVVALRSHTRNRASILVMF